MKAIRWAVEQDARVINMSLGGFRDPRDPDRDAFSPLEAQAIGWAHGRGVVIVAAVGNNTDTPPSPWPYASYPAALPHVLGVSALARDGSVPAFSHRDKIYNDIAAPGRHPLDVPARAHGREQGVSGAGLLELCPGRLPQGPGHVVRSAAGERRGGSPARGPARASGPSR